MRFGKAFLIRKDWFRVACGRPDLSLVWDTSGYKYVKVDSALQYSPTQRRPVKNIEYNTMLADKLEHLFLLTCHSPDLFWNNSKCVCKPFIGVWMFVGGFAAAAAPQASPKFPHWYMQIQLFSVSIQIVCTSKKQVLHRIYTCSSLLVLWLAAFVHPPHPYASRHMNTGCELTGRKHME